MSDLNASKFYICSTFIFRNHQSTVSYKKLVSNYFYCDKLQSILLNKDSVWKDRVQIRKWLITQRQSICDYELRLGCVVYNIHE